MASTSSTSSPQEQQMNKSQISELLNQVKQQKIEDDAVDVPSDNLPDRDTVVVPGMKAELDKYHLEMLLEKRKAAKKTAKKLGLTTIPEDSPFSEEELNYLSPTHIAKAFMAPRKAIYKPSQESWLKDALFIFAHSRAFDYVSAARRFYKFNEELAASAVCSLDEIPHDVAETISAAALYYHPPHPDAQGRAIVYANLKTFTFADGFTVKQMKRMNMWLFWQWATRFGSAPQVKGLMFVLSYTGFSMGAVNNEYKAWTDKVMLEMLPIKMNSVVLAYPPFWVNSILWPLMKLVMKQKMLDRIQWLGNEPEKVKAKFMMHAYRQPTGLFLSKPESLTKFCKNQKIDLPASCSSAAEASGEEAAKLQTLLATVPDEFGGTLELNPEFIRAHVKSMWTVSDEAVPEGCYRIDPKTKTEVKSSNPPELVI